MKNNPYVGPRPYERDDRQNFYGRQREARDLTSLIMGERVVLFYAPSGAGKTSLLNAQVIPALEEEAFNVLPPVRVSSTPPPIIAPYEVDNIFIFSVLMGLAGEGIRLKELTKHTLLSFLREQGLDREENGVEEGWGFDDRPPILILDQFEEIFTTHQGRWRDAQGFFKQVQDALHEMPTLGVVFTMREDYVAELDPYAPLLPGRLRARFRMERLNREGALEAVRKPALNAGCPFDPGVAERLVDDLRRIKQEPRFLSETEFLGPYVEPVQLQVVCSRLWDNLPEQEDNAIQWEEIEAFGDVDQALTDFYEDGLKRCVKRTGVSESQVRRWAGEQLITPMGTRGLTLRGERETGGLPNPAVDILEEHHLIRADRRAGARWYELAHDRLVDPILQSNRAWRAARETPLRKTARRWEKTDADSLFYRGEALKEALAWAEGHPSEVEPYEQDFLNASRKAERNRIRLRNLRIVGAAMAAAIIILVSFLAWTFNRASHIARSKEYASISMRWRSVNQEQSILLARLAVEEADTTEAEIALRQSVIDFYPSKLLEGSGVASVYEVDYSPDGRFLAAAMANGQVRIWEAEAETRHTDLIDASERAVWDVAYSPGGRFLATAGNDKTIHLWDISSGTAKEFRTLTGHTGPIYSLDYSPACVSLPDASAEECGRFLASASYDKTVRVWDISHRTSLGRPWLSSVISLTGHMASVEGVAFSPECVSLPDPSAEGCGRRLATGSWDDTVRIWDVSITPQGALTAATALTLTAHTGDVTTVAFSPNGELLASGSRDKTIRLWDAATGEALLTLVGHTDGVLSLAFSPDGRFLISGARDATVRLWDVGARKDEPVATLTGHSSIVNGVAFSPGCDSLPDTSAEECGRFIASGSGDQSVRVWDGDPPTDAQYKTLIGHKNTVEGLDYSPECDSLPDASAEGCGRFLATGDTAGTAYIWDANTGQRSATFPIGHRIWDVTYSLDGRYLVICAADDKAYIWDVSTRTPVTVLSGHEKDVNVAAYSPDGQLLATVSDDRTARLWDTTNWETTRTFEGHEGAIYALDYSSDGRFIATGSTDDDVRIWDVKTGTSVVTLTGHTHDVFDVTFSPDDKFLASASWDQTAIIWNLETYTRETTLTGHSGYVYGVAYSPECDSLPDAPAGGCGRYLATSSWDKTVRVWDLTQKPPKTIAILTGHTDYIPSVAYSPDGRIIATGSKDGTVRRYPARFEDALELSRQYVPRELTAEELFSILGEER